MAQVRESLSSVLRTAEGASLPSNSFLVSGPVPKSRQLEEGRRLLVHFIEEYLALPGLFAGFQSRFGHGSDLILFRSPKTGSTFFSVCHSECL